MKKVWLFHLFNDYSGSPLVLKNTVLALQETYKITIVTSPTLGFLSHLGVRYKDAAYKWSPNKFVTLYRFLRVNIRYFFLILFHSKKIDLIYVNTLLPFGAAMGAKFCKKKVVYHMHEPQVNPPKLFQFLKNTAIERANKAFFVSDYLLHQFPELEPQGQILYNSLNERFVSKAVITPPDERKTVLMLGSFKAYKGVYDFVELAKLNPNRTFELVLNAKESQIKQFVKDNKTIENLKIYPSTKNVHPYFAKARVLLNLSHPTEWIESFGMTVLEGMTYALPCIVPTVGGIAELVDEQSGFKIDHTAKQKITNVIEQLFTNEELYNTFSEGARQRSLQFRFDTYQNQLITQIEELL